MQKLLITIHKHLKNHNVKHNININQNTTFLPPLPGHLQDSSRVESLLYGGSSRSFTDTHVDTRRKRCTPEPGLHKTQSQTIMKNTKDYEDMHVETQSMHTLPGSIN